MIPFARRSFLGACGKGSSPTAASDGSAPTSGSTGSVASSNAPCVVTPQLTDLVHRQAPYRQKGRRDTLNSTDGIYRGGGPVLLTPLAAAGGGYGGTFHVGVQV